MATIKPLSLAELRLDRGVTQVQMAERMGIAQESVSRMERAANVTIRSAERFVAALGGELEIEARFADEYIPVRFGEKP